MKVLCIKEAQMTDSIFTKDVPQVRKDCIYTVVREYDPSPIERIIFCLTPGKYYVLAEMREEDYYNAKLFVPYNPEEEKEVVEEVKVKEMILN